MGMLREFFKLLSELTSTKMLKSRIINEQFSVFIFLFLISLYYLAFLFLLAFFNMGRLYLVTLLIVAISTLMLFFLVRIYFFLSFELASLFNPDVVYPELKLNARKVASKYRLFYFLPFFTDILFILIILLKPGTKWLIAVPAFIVLLYTAYYILYRIYLYPLNKASQRYFLEHNSDILIYFAGVINTEYQINQWIPIFKELEKKYRVTVIFQQAHFFSYGTTLSIPAMRLGNIRRLANFLENGNIKMIFYLNNAGSNYSLLVFRKYTHIHLNHGDSDKAANAENTARDYNYVFIAGQASLDRHVQIGWDPSQLKIVGRPQIEFLKQGYNRGTGKGKKTVLYAPTFEGNKEIDCYSSVKEFGMTIIRSIVSSRKYRLVVKLHPYTGVFLEEYARAGNEIKRFLEENAADGHQWIDQIKPQKSLYELFLESDLVISDVSSVAIDFLTLDRPIIATNPFGISEVDGEKRFPFWKGAHILNPNQDVMPLIDEAIMNDPKKQIRETMAKYYLGEKVFERRSTIKEFCKIVDEILTLRQTKRIKG